MEVFKMPEFKLSKEAGTKKFELSMAIDYDEDGNIEAQEFYDGVDWSDNPADIRLNTSYCDEDEQDEWNLFFNDFIRNIRNHFSNIIDIYWIVHLKYQEITTL